MHMHIPEEIVRAIVQHMVSLPASSHTHFLIAFQRTVPSFRIDRDDLPYAIRKSISDKHQKHEDQASALAADGARFAGNVASGGVAAAAGNLASNRPSLKGEMARYPSISSALKVVEDEYNGTRQFSQFTTSIKLSVGTDNIGELLLILYKHLDKSSKSDLPLTDSEVLIQLIEKRGFALEIPDELSSSLMILGFERLAKKHEYELDLA